jgi:hypothetical protein
MTDLFHLHIHPLTAIRHGAAAALLAGGVFFGLGQAPAAAQSTSWEEGCATRVVTPGSGDILRTTNCGRQKDCQQMANAQGSMMMDKGCFFVMPNASAPASQAGQARPVRKQ